jgi:DNA-binding transcriptional LysR family regulator
MNIDSNCFRSFQAAAQSLNFTEAARMIAMTQSGISQHIAKLESEIGAELFLRVGKKVILTDAGRSLLKFIDEYNDQLISLKDKIQENTSALTGKVNYAMPATCLLSPHFSLFLNNRKSNFPGVDINVDLHSSEEVITKVLEAKIDFGFVTKKIINDELEYTAFCEEEYVLVSASKITHGPLKEQNWIHYPGCEVLAEAWLKSSKQNKGQDFKIKFNNRTNSLHAAFTMVAQEVGVMIVPRHCVESSELKSKLRIHELNRGSCRNMIYIVSLKSETKPKRVVKVIETFMKIKN